MRVLFFLLLLVNLVYFAFGWLQPTPQEQQPQVYVQKGELLQRLGEDASPSGEEAFQQRRKRYCLAMGPWANVKDAERSQSLNEDLGLEGRIERLALRKNLLHWVYLPPFDSRADASEMLKELHFKGVDSFIVTEGEDENAVSLGYFSNKDSAIGLRTKMNSEGYDAQIRETWRDVVEFWLVFDVLPFQKESAESIYNSADDEGLTVMQVSCTNS